MTKRLLFLSFLLLLCFCLYAFISKKSNKLSQHFFRFRKRGGRFLSNELLLLCYLLIDGYSLFSLILASLFVNCQLMVEFLLFRCSCQSATSFFISSMVEICLFKHCLFKTCNSISAILSQLPCFGVNTKSNLSHILLASSGSNASYSAPGVCVLKLSITNVILSACGNISSDIFLIK